MSARNVVFWAFPTPPSSPQALVCAREEEERRGGEEGAAHFERAWFTVGCITVHQSPSQSAHSSTRLINLRHFHEWWTLRYLRGCSKLIKPQRTIAAPGRTITKRYFRSGSAAVASIIQPSLLRVSRVVINIDQPNISWMRIRSPGIGGGAISGLNMWCHSKLMNADSRSVYLPGQEYKDISLPEIEKPTPKGRAF